MARYKPTRKEIVELMAWGWRFDDDGWWWPAGVYGYGSTYREARREQQQRERRLTSCPPDRATLPDAEVTPDTRPAGDD